MKRKTYLILIWSITLCVIVISSTVTFVQTKGLFAQVWNQIAEKLEESFDFNLKFVSKNDDWNSNDNTDSDFSSKKEFETNLEEFSKLNLDGNIMSFQIKDGETWRIECSYSHTKLKPEFTNKNGTLYITQKNQIQHRTFYFQVYDSCIRKTRRAKQGCFTGEQGNFLETKWTG